MSEAVIVPKELLERVTAILLDDLPARKTLNVLLDLHNQVQPYTPPATKGSSDLGEG